MRVFPEPSSKVRQTSDTVTAWGHRNVTATHDTTLEITTEPALTKRGDCIVAVGANKACRQLPPELKTRLRTQGERVEIRISCGGEEDVVVGEGDEGLTLNSSVSMVVRRSRFLSDRTLVVGADKAARDLSRDLVTRMREGLPVVIHISVDGYNTAGPEDGDM